MRRSGFDRNITCRETPIIHFASMAAADPNGTIPDENKKPEENGAEENDDSGDDEPTVDANGGACTIIYS